MGNSQCEGRTAGEAGAKWWEWVLSQAADAPAEALGGPPVQAGEGELMSTHNTFVITGEMWKRGE